MPRNDWHYHREPGESIWRTCERIRDGKVCGNKSRRMNGRTCSTCYSADWKRRNAQLDKLNREIYYLEHCEKMKAAARARYWADPESSKERAAAWQRQNKERDNARRRAKRKAARGNLEKVNVSADRFGGAGASGTEDSSSVQQRNRTTAAT